jgi:hypothetical protein
VLEEAFKSPLTIEDPKLEVVPKSIDHAMVIGGSQVVRKPKTTKVRMVKSKMSAKKISRLEKVTANLYDLEDAHGPEKPLHIDLNLYQMEDY